jgi:hypothetical protein
VTTSGPDRTRARLTVCTLLALLAAHYAYSHALEQYPKHADFAQMWFAARTILHGGDPYPVMGPGLPFDYDWPWYYPLTAAIAAVPIAPFSEAIAVAFVVGISAACFAWALTAAGWWPLLAFTSICTLQALHVAQWAPLLASALVILPLGVLLIAKPTIGAAIFVARPSRWAVVGGLLLLLVAFAVQPSWLAEWRATLASPLIRAGKRAPHLPPVSYPEGVLVLAALTRWRRPEARLLVAMACVPQTTLPYEAVPLFLVPRGGVESSLLVALSWAMVSWVKHYHHTGMAATVADYGQTFVWFLYVPCVLMVMRRPNEGSIPAWLQQRIALWPPWIRGRASEPMPDSP